SRRVRHGAARRPYRAVVAEAQDRRRACALEGCGVGSLDRHCPQRVREGPEWPQSGARRCRRSVTAGARVDKRLPDTLAIRHVPFEDLGLLEPLLRQRGHAVRYAEAPVDDLAAIDPLGPELLVVLGGPIGVYESSAYPFIERERELLARRLAARRPTLGI